MRILYTSDIHGYVTNKSYAFNTKENQGLAGLATYIKMNKDENTLLIDNGDIIQGSPLTYYHHLYNEDNINPLALCFNELKYDYFNIGNHDFNYHQDVLVKFINDINAKCITGNIKGNHKLEFNYQKINIENKNVVIIGVTNDYIKNWELKDNILGLEFIDAFDYLKYEISNLKKHQDYDYLIVCYHGGFEKNLDGSDLDIESPDNKGYKMLSMLPEIDLLLTGHQHRSIVDTVNKTNIVQVTCNAKEIAKIDICLDTKETKMEIIQNKFEQDEKILEIIEHIENDTQKWLDKPLGSLVTNDAIVTDGFIARRDNHPCISFLNQIQLEHYDADVSAISLFNDAKGFNQNITMRDVVSTYVYPNTLVKLEITGKQLKNYLENSVKYFDIVDDEIVIAKSYYDPKPIHYEYDILYGIDYLVKVSNPIGNKVIEIKKDDKVILDDQILTMVINNYRLAGGGNYNVIKECKIIANDGLEMVDIIAEYIIKNSPINIKHTKNLKLIK